MLAAILLTGALGHAALGAGLVGIAFVAWAAPRRGSPATIALWLGFTCLAAAGVLATTSSAESTGIDIKWVENLICIAVVVLGLGGGLAMLEFRTRERTLRKTASDAESGRREVERLTGLNVKLEDELQEHRRRPPKPAEERGSSSAMNLEATVVRQRKALEAANAAARRLRAVIDGAVEGMALLERETLRLSEVNPALVALTGLPEKELAAKTLMDLFAAAEHRPGKSDLQRAARERSAMATVVQRPDGQTIPVELTITVVGDAADAALLVVIRDVSSLRVAVDDGEKALILSRERVRQAEEDARQLEERCRNLEAERARLVTLHEQKDEYISSVSHELRTPLTNIRSFSEILLKHVDTEPAMRREFLEIINKETERLTRMVNNVLDLARIEAGATKLQLTDFDARSVVADVVASMGAMSQERKVRIEVMAGSEPRPMRADRDRVMQLVMNLLSNALRYSDEGQAVQVRLEDAGPEGRVRFAVEDHGKGISQEDAGRIFDKFQRVEDGSEASRKGTGLGLAICREIATMHNGKIWVDSELGKGSTFRAEFPGVEEARSRPQGSPRPGTGRFGAPAEGEPQVPRLGRTRQAASVTGTLPPLGR